MISKQEHIARAFNFLQDVYDICEQVLPLSITTTLKRHKLYGGHFRKAILESGLIEYVEDTSPRIYTWVNGIIPNKIMAERLVKSAMAIKKKEESMQQRCTVCGEMKPLADFKTDINKSTGRSNICKTCSSESGSLIEMDYGPKKETTTLKFNPKTTIDPDTQYIVDVDKSSVNKIPTKEKDYVISFKVPKQWVAIAVKYIRLGSLFCAGVIVGILLMWILN